MTSLPATPSTTSPLPSQPPLRNGDRSAQERHIEGGEGNAAQCALCTPSQTTAPALTGQQKYTVQPQGIWGRIHKFFALDPGRSSGVPLNPHFRNPPPGGNDPTEYIDPVTVPAADLAENPYWKRDVRRSYPRLSTVTQSDVVGLLSVGSAAAPKDTLKIGDAGKTQLVEVKEEGEKGLSTYFEKNKQVFQSVLGPDGLPPLPTSRHLGTHNTSGAYSLRKEEEQTYGPE